MIAILFFLITASITGFAQWRGFQPLQTYQVTEVANLVHTKDITGDGIPDLTAMYSANNNKWGILKGINNGRFQHITHRTKEDNYHLSDIADFNRDGYPDMVISSYWNNGFVIWFGQPSGQFVKGPFMHTGTHGRAVKCMDMNRDGWVDIVSTTSGSGNAISMHVFIGKGDGTFQSKKSYPSLLDTCKEIFITDQNNDGRWDVMVTSPFPWVLVYLQHIDGSFSPVYHPTFNTARPAVADVNNDGKEDLVLLYASFDNAVDSDSLIIKLNNGTDYWTPSIQVPAFENRKLRPFHIRIADINVDGNTDLLFNHTDANGDVTDSLFYMLGKGNAQFEEPKALKMPGKIAYITVADLNGDRLDDLIISCYNNTINIILNKGQLAESEESWVQIYPNPATSRFYIKASFKTAHNLRIYNVSGQLVKEQIVMQPTTPVYTNGLGAGIYYVDVKGKEINTRQAILVR
jgi:hypothetical protein